MAHLWVMDVSCEWTLRSLDGDAMFISTSPSGADFFSTAAIDEPAVALHRVNNCADAEWALFTDDRAHTRVNGRSVPLGMLVLADRDEVRLASGPPMFFSTERLAAVATYPDSAPPGRCPRCKQLIDAGSSAVQCPTCRLWHHAAHDLPCWTYAPHCSACSQPTALDAGFQWTPEEL